MTYDLCAKSKSEKSKRNEEVRESDQQQLFPPILFQKAWMDAKSLMTLTSWESIFFRTKAVGVSPVESVIVVSADASMSSMPRTKNRATSNNKHCWNNTDSFMSSGNQSSYQSINQPSGV
jgi:hypothetical protein